MAAQRFWSDTTSTAKDPKRQFRWVLASGSSVPAYTLKKVTKPSFTVEETEHKFLSHTYYYPGRVKWNSVEMTLADPVEPDVAASIASIVRNSGYNPPTKFGGNENRTSISKVDAVGALGTIKIQQLNSTGEVIETWTLVNAWVKDVKFGELDYESDDLTDVTVELRYDWAEIKSTHAPAVAATGYTATTKVFDKDGVKET